jgi:ElaB/YqjD/DUF883 family membrane-anchored ribosome-binding protein
MDLNQGANTMSNPSEAVNRLEDSARSTLSDVSNRVVEKSRAAATTTDAYIHEYAWSSVALAALLGVVIGLMIRRS